MAESDSERLVFEEGVMFSQVTIDGVDVRAGITLPAIERLIARAGLEVDRDWGTMMVSHLIGLLTPTIEAHLQARHFLEGARTDPLIIDLPDLTTH